MLNIFSSISVSIYFSAKYYLLSFLIILITLLGIHTLTSSFISKEVFSVTHAEGSQLFPKLSCFDL